ncbi:MAG: low specificity L-threonine aldolase [Rhodospirillaceae bacterium]|nr:low specificity L-threonine aldolase [Rhodospirillaceae bacterium]
MNNFLSDNVSGISREILEGLNKINHGSANSYGEDDQTKKLQNNANSLFEKEVSIFPVTSGTAANSIAFASCVPPYGAILCSQESHINQDECNAPEFYTGGAKLVKVKSSVGKIIDANLSNVIENLAPHGIHNAQPILVSITQSTELGTIYTLDEIRSIAKIAKENNILLHMDGARIANAVTSLNCSWADITWKSGVDILSFGATKNGTFGSEAIIYFNKNLSKNVEYYRKRGGHLISKMRFISSQLNSYIETGIWEKNAKNANEMAKTLEKHLNHIVGVDVVYPVESNSVFVKMPDDLVEKLYNRGFAFGQWGKKAKKIYRIMASFDTNKESIINFSNAIKEEIECAE